MKKLGKQGLILLLCVLSLAGGALAAGLPEGDSLLSLSYFTQTYIPQMTAQGAQQARDRLDQTYEAAAGRLDALSEGYLEQAGTENGGLYSAAYTRQTFSLYDTVTLSPGAGLLLEQGAASAGYGGAVVDVTSGEEVLPGDRLTSGHRYLAAGDDPAVLTVESDAVRLALQGEYALARSGVPATPFTDISTYDWYQSAVQEVYRRGLFAGTEDGSIFTPENRMNRAMMMTVLFHLAGDPDHERFAAVKTFSDVPQGEWYTSYVSWAAEQNVSAGYGGGVFKPLQNMTRQEVVQFIYNFGRSYLGLCLEERADLSAYPDAGQVEDWAYEAMSWAAGVGIISSLAPANQASRAEVAAMLSSFTAIYF